MIDFIKSVTKNEELIMHFRNHPLLEWRSDQDRFNPRCPELLRTKKELDYEGIKFIFADDRLEVKFFPHYYLNRNRHNSNDFTMIECLMVMLEFRALFGVELYHFPVSNLEYGVNVLPSLKIEDTISYFYCHDRNEFKSDAGLSYSRRSSKDGRGGRINNYKIIKAYAKGLQPGAVCDRNTLRFEVKSHESKFIKSLGISTMEDLLRPEVYYAMGESIITEFENVLIVDGSVDTKALSAPVVRQLESYSNPMRWYKILQGSRNLFSLEKKKYYNLLGRTGKHLKQQLAEIIQEKVYSLTESKVEVQVPMY